MLRLRQTVLIAGLLAICAMPASALKFDVSLAPIRVDAQAGQTHNRTFRLTLAKDEQRTQFKVHVQDWWRSEDGKESFYKPPGTIPQSCAPWIKLNPVESSVMPGENLDVKLTIAVPEGTKTGGYWCAFTVDEVLDPLKINPEGVGVRFLASLSIGFFVYVGPVNRSAKILDVSVGDEAVLKIQNVGNCPLRVEGRFEFIPVGQKSPIARADFAQTTVLHTPVNSAFLRAQLPDATKLPSGRYLVRAIYDIGLDHYKGVQKEILITRGPSVASIPGESK